MPSETNFEASGFETRAHAESGDREAFVSIIATDEGGNKINLRVEREAFDTEMERHVYSLLEHRLSVANELLVTAREEGLKHVEALRSTNAGLLASIKSTVGIKRPKVAKTADPPTP